MFTGYAAASPAIGWDKQVLSKFEKSFGEKKLSTPVHVYMTVGDVESGRPQFEKFASNMLSRHYSNVALRSKVLENTGHSGTKSETYSRGLQFIFERRQLKFSKDVLSNYAGTYQIADGSKITIKNEGDELYWYFSPGFKFALLADSDTHFYASHEFFNVYFKFSNGKIEGLNLARYGNTQTLKKVN
jgi:hypothetical protein